MYSIRDFKPCDKDGLIKMVAETLGEYSMSIDMSGVDSELENMGSVYGQDNSKFYVMENDGKIIGSVGVRHVDDNICELRKLYLLKRYRGRGLGHELLDKAIIFAVDKGYKKIQLEVSGKHEQAILLYKNAGFVKVDRESSCPRCELIFEKRLDPVI